MSATPHRVIMRTETGEEVRAVDTTFPSLEAAIEWCEDNEDNYPESRLFVEPEYSPVNALFEGW